MGPSLEAVESMLLIFLLSCTTVYVVGKWRGAGEAVQEAALQDYLVLPLCHSVNTRRGDGEGWKFPMVGTGVCFGRFAWIGAKIQSVPVIDFSALRMKIKEVKKENGDKKIVPKKKKPLKLGPIKKKELKRLVLFLKNGADCPCHQLDNLSHNFLIMGRKVKSQYLLTAIHKWDKKNKEFKNFMKKMKTHECPTFQSSLLVTHEKEAANGYQLGVEMLLMAYVSFVCNREALKKSMSGNNCDSKILGSSLEMCVNDRTRIFGEKVVEFEKLLKPTCFETCSSKTGSFYAAENIYLREIATPTFFPVFSSAFKDRKLGSTPWWEHSAS
ncbi:hypothetical protein A6R68_04711 [Neotoma lepida]|uniref:NTR domain-containing protein n=1 Tax=Neotoma lepida TaxID=56216 RepID=A0A1A6GKF2_NEOLE|nr:hypothetical protein A6R68_04711 [Neotoma lepida]